ncbi:MAG: hypothetical protein IJR13_05065 [Bacteroidales bacterium]|nr:hypothetical protein [Bacteroidales bacterium]
MAISYAIIASVSVALIVAATLVFYLRRKKKLSDRTNSSDKRNAVKKNRLVYSLLPHHHWKTDKTFAQHDRGPMYVYLKDDVPIEHDEKDIYVYTRNVSDRTLRLLKEHDADLRKIAAERDFRLINPIIGGTNLTLGDTTIEIDATTNVVVSNKVLEHPTLEDIVRQYADQELPDRPAFLHYQPLLTKEEYTKAATEHRTPRIVYSVYYIDDIPTENGKGDFLNEKMGQIPDKFFSDEYALERLLDNLRTLCSLIILHPAEYYSSKCEKEPGDTHILFHIDTSSSSGLAEYEKNKAKALQLLRAIDAPASIIDEVSKLSRTIQDVELIITSDLAICVAKKGKDYLAESGRLNVNMSPLSKALYFLYLRHPEGIAFKQLVDYRSEIMELYSIVSRRENIEKLSESISLLTDAVNNSVNEKCSRIKHAFVVLENDLPRSNINHFIITGVAGGIRRITIERNKILDLSGLVLANGMRNKS